MGVTPGAQTTAIITVPHSLYTYGIGDLKSVDLRRILVVIKASMVPINPDKHTASI